MQGYNYNNKNNQGCSMSLQMFSKKNSNKNQQTQQSKETNPNKSTKKVEAVVSLRSTSKAKSWVASLPMTDMGETTRRLFGGLMTLNQESVPPQVRIEITEIILPYIKMALENLDRRFMSRSFPLPERSQKVFDLKKALLMETAGSYQLAALEMLTKESVSKKKLLLSIGRAITYMSHVLINGYEVYSKTDESLWHDIHHLYLLAFENEVHNIIVPSKDDIHGDEITIEDQYKLVNLIALSAPNTLRQSEILKVRDFFRLCLDDVSIVTDPATINSKYAHIALMNTDEPATLMPVSDLVSSATSRIFDLSKVIHALDEFVSLSESTGLGTHQKWAMLTHSLAKRLAYVLTTIRNRRFKRFPREEKGLLAIRMVDVISIIRENSSDSFMDQLNDDIGDDNTYEALAAGDTVSSPWSDIDMDALSEDRDVKLHSWQFENSSSGGYGLRQVMAESSTARVGELVAIQDPKDEANLWQIAVVRWMDTFKDIGLRIGLEILSLHGMVVQVDKISNREITQKLPLEGIMLPSVEGSRETSNLIFPGFIFRVDDELTLTLGSRQQLVTIDAIDDTVGGFAYCSFDQREEEDVPEGSMESFENIWEFL